MPTPPSPIDALSTPPSSTDPANFDTRGDAFLGAMPTMATQMNAAGTVTYNNAVEAAASATTANAARDAAIAVADAAMWSAATNYPTGTAAISPITYKTYIRKSPGGVDATDPSASALWEPQSLTRVNSGRLEFWDGTQWVPQGTVTLIEGLTLTGSAYDLTGIGSWARELEVQYVSISGAADGTFGVQAGSSAGVVTTGYESSAWGSGGSNLIGTARYTAGFYVSNGQTAAFVMQGQMILRRHSGNIWRASGSGQVEGAPTNFGNSGKVTLSGTLDRLRFNFSSGTTFDGGLLSVFARA